MISYNSLLLLYSGASLGWVTHGATHLRAMKIPYISLLLLYLGTIGTANGTSTTGVTDHLRDVSNGYNDQIIQPEQDYTPTGIADHLRDVSNGNNDQIIQMYQTYREEDMGFEQQCPIAEDIAPCVCIYDDYINAMGLDCSDVESEEQLKQVFESYFPLKKLRGFKMEGNKYLKVIESSVFGNISFEIIDISYNVIEIVQNDAFKSCYETATEFWFHKNQNILSFPFNDISKLSNLRHIDISSNYFDTFPLDIFHGLTNVVVIDLEMNHATFTGNFQNNPNLEELYLSYNNVSTIPANFLKTGSNHLNEIHLDHNQIVSVEPDAFEYFEGPIVLDHNLLTTLDEATWRPIFEVGMFIWAGNNPLKCGCDVAWLFGEDDLLMHVSGDSICKDGQFLHDLDPKIFDLC